MKSINILIAGLMLILFSGVLSGCQMENAAETNELPAEVSSDLPVETQANIQVAQAVEKQAEIKLDSQTEGEKVVVEITIQNEANQPIQSVQSWLSYNPDQLKGLEINAADSDFLLVAPYENTFDAEKGLVSLGRSNPEPLTKEEIKVATLTFQKISAGAATLDAYDYQEDLTGSSSVNIIVNEKPYNILKKPESPLLIIQ